MPSSPNPLPVQLTRFNEVVKVTNYTELWDAEFT